MRQQEEISPSIEAITVNEDTALATVMRKMGSSSHVSIPAGICVVVNKEGKVTGTVTDGDVRRALLENKSFEQEVRSFMNDSPILFSDGISYRDILKQIPEELHKRGRRSRRFLGKIIFVDNERKPVRVMNYHHLWEQRVATHRHVVIIGMGYVGLTLALEFAEEGFLVTGVDQSQDVVDLLNSGNSHVHEKGLKELLREQLKGNFHVAQEIPEDGDVFIIAVGTPLSSKDNEYEPSLEYLTGASRMVAEKLAPGDLVVLRSTVPVGTCRKHVLRILEDVSGLKSGVEFHLSFAPERTAEGKALQELRTLPQIIGGLNDDSIEATAALFRELTPTIIRVESLESAELIKLINNGFRDHVFAFSNELVKLASVHNLDIVDCINAANQGYPRNPVPLPSPGVGGPCLTKDPYILSASLESNTAGGLLLPKYSREVNEGMYLHIANAVIRQLKGIGKELSKCRILLCGLAFKGNPETGDIRNSAALEIFQLLKNEVKEVSGHDPVVRMQEILDNGLNPILDIVEAFTNQDAVLFLNNHVFYEKINVFELLRLMNEKPVFFDGWHTFYPDEILNIRPSVYMGLSIVKSSI